jgi:hypothetical protein
MEWAMMTPLASLVLGATIFVLFGGLTAWFGGSSGTVTSSEDGAAGLVGAVLLGFVGPVVLIGVAGVLFSISLLVVIITVYFDSKTLETADIGWQPNAAVFGLITFFFQPFVFYYLYKRHEYVVDWVDSGRWGTVAAGSLVLSTLLAGGGLVAMILGQVGLPMILVSLGVVALAPFPYAIYRDSTYVRLNSGSWQPNPGATFPVALASMLLLPPSYLLFGGYYLYKRRQALPAA